MPYFSTAIPTALAVFGVPQNSQRQHTCATRYGMSRESLFVYVCVCLFVRGNRCTNGCGVCVRTCVGVCGRMACMCVTRELTWMPDVVKYGISNLTLIGGLPSLSSASTLGRPKWARIRYSFPPCRERERSTDTALGQMVLQHPADHVTLRGTPPVLIGERCWARTLTGKDLMDQTISLFSGTHLTLPTVVLNLGESASVGTGMWISTLLAVDRLLNWLLA